MLFWMLSNTFSSWLDEQAAQPEGHFPFHKCNMVRWFHVLLKTETQLFTSAVKWFQRMWGPREPGWGPGWCLGSTQQCCTSLIYLQLLVGTVCWIQQHYCCFDIYYSYMTVVFPQWADGGAQEEQRERERSGWKAGSTHCAHTACSLRHRRCSPRSPHLRSYLAGKQRGGGVGGGLSCTHGISAPYLTWMCFFFYLGIRSVYSISVPFRWRSAIFNRPKTKGWKRWRIQPQCRRVPGVELLCVAWSDLPVTNNQSFVSGSLWHAFILTWKHTQMVPIQLPLQLSASSTF